MQWEKRFTSFSFCAYCSICPVNSVFIVLVASRLVRQCSAWQNTDMMSHGIPHYWGGITFAAQAIPPIPTFLLISVVYHIYALCLNRLTTLDAIWQVHLWGPMTHCVRWSPWPPREGGGGDLGRRTYRQIAKLSVPCCHLANTNVELYLQQQFSLLPNYLLLLMSLTGCKFDCMHCSKCIISGMRLFRWIPALWALTTTKKHKNSKK